MRSDVVTILLVEDNPTDVMMTREALDHHGLPHRLYVAEDGIVAMDYLTGSSEREGRGAPELIILDLNLPRKGGREVLAEIKAHPRLRAIPVVVLTTSRSPDDIRETYSLYANCYITKPVDYTEFVDAVRTFNEFWFKVATLPMPPR